MMVCSRVKVQVVQKHNGENESPFLVKVSNSNSKRFVALYIKRDPTAKGKTPRERVKTSLFFFLLLQTTTTTTSLSHVSYHFSRSE